MLHVTNEVAGRFTARDEDNDREATFYRMSKQEPGRPCLYLINTINGMENIMQLTIQQIATRRPARRLISSQVREQLLNWLGAIGIAAMLVLGPALADWVGDAIAAIVGAM